MSCFPSYRRYDLRVDNSNVDEVGDYVSFGRNWHDAYPMTPFQLCGGG